VSLQVAQLTAMLLQSLRSPPNHLPSLHKPLQFVQNTRACTGGGAHVAFGASNLDSNRLGVQVCEQIA
jgi:hypothetical protein